MLRESKRENMMKDSEKGEMITLIDDFIEVLERLRDEQRLYFGHWIIYYKERFYLDEQITKLIFMRRDIQKGEYDERT